jgi:hypothetical protein
LQPFSFMKEIEIIRRVFIAETTSLVKNKNSIAALMMMSQGIEALGAYLDDKPLKAKKQSKRRFSLALKKLFPLRYTLLNEKDFLYNQLRCNLSHLLIPGKNILSLYREESTETHLSFQDEKLILIMEDLLDDFVCACEKVMLMIEEGKLKNKKRMA